jgi:DNA repair exonuclease SbcCD ATPase subunit
MGFKIKIVKTEGPLAKLDEIEILKQLAGAFTEHDGYCKSLFREELVSWAAGQIRLDLPPDIWAECLGASAAQAEIARETQELKIELNSKAKTLQRALEENADLKKKAKAFTAELAELEDAREALANQEALIEEMRREMTILGQAHGEQRAALEKARQDILVLKARLYDLEHPENVASPAAEQDPLPFPYQQTAAA